MFLAPSLVCLLAFSLGPMVGTAVDSLQEWNLHPPGPLHRPRQLPRAAGTTRTSAERCATRVYYLVGYLPLVTSADWGWPCSLNTQLRGAGVPPRVYFLPVVTSWVVVALLWKWLLNPNDGLVNWALGLVGIRGSRLVDVEPPWAMPSVILASAWKDLGFVMVILLAGLQAIPPSLYEAATHRRRRPVAAAAPHHAPAADAVAVLRRRDQPDQRLPGVRPGVRDDRAAARTARRRSSSSRSTSNTFRYGRRRLRIGPERGAVRHHPRRHRRAAAAAEAVGPLCVSGRRPSSRTPRSCSRYVGDGRCARPRLIGPFVWMVLASLKTDADIGRLPPAIIPDPITGENYRRVVDAFPFWRFARNSVVVAVTSTRSSWSRRRWPAYAFARIEFRGRAFVFGLYLATMMIPLQVIIVPLFIEMRNLGLVDTFAGLLLPTIVSSVRRVPAPPGLRPRCPASSTRRRSSTGPATSACSPRSCCPSSARPSRRSRCSPSWPPGTRSSGRS